MGLLTGKKNQADSIFSEIETNYLGLKSKTMYLSTRPSVLIGDLYNGIWYAPGGSRAKKESD